MKPERWQQIEQLYYAAMEREPDDRAVFLAQACAGDEELHREVSALLKYDHLVGSFIERPAFVLEARARIAETSARESAHETSRSPIPGKIGPYTLLGPLGKGGMGEVHLALDARLNRKVAIKLLPSEFTADDERVRRFEQEARAASALNHPNIITIHEIGQHEGTHYLVTEFIDGETLRQRMARDQQRIRLTEVLEITAQIAAALYAAHEAGIIHRDIKPENVMVRQAGLVKVLDFGLAKLNPEEGSRPPDSMTQSGIVMGTVRYMSPEQVRGQKVDRRTDIFSLGVVLYEMLAGRKPFEGETSSDVIAAVLRNEPALLSEIAPNTPIALQRIVMRCLETKPEKRFQSAGDLSFALEALITPSEARSGVAAAALPGAEGNTSVPTLLRRLSKGWIAWMMAGILALAVIWLAVADFKRPAAEVNAIRFLIPPPEKMSFIGFTDTNYTFSVSPDGRRLVFVVASDEKRRRLWVRPLDSLTAQPLEGTDGAISPFWSPDSQFIGFFAQGKLKKIAAAGGLPTELCAGRYSSSGTWNRDGVILFSSILDKSGIYRVSDAGGEPMPVTKLDPAKNEGFHSWPHFLPDGRHFLYLSRELGGQPAHTIYLGTLDSGETKPLIQAASRVAYALGYLLYVSEGVLLAHPFDDRQLRFTGGPVHVVEQVSYFAPTGRASFSVSDNGVLVYATVDEKARLVWLDRSGKEIGSVGQPAHYTFLRLSPDGKQIVTSITDPRFGTNNLWLQDLTRNPAMRLTSHPGQEEFPVWSPDNRLVYSADRAGPPSLYLRTLRDEGEGQPLTRGSGHLQVATDWSRDGQFILYNEGSPKTMSDIYALPVGGDRQPIPVLHTQFDEQDAHFSPDGHWIAYVSNESGQPEVYVRPFQSEGEKQRISTGGGNSPRWPRDRKEIFYIAPSKEMMAVPVKIGANVERGLPTALFKADPAQFLTYDVTPDGQRFLICTAPVRAADLPLTVVVHWTAQVKR